VPIFRRESIVSRTEQEVPLIDGNVYPFSGVFSAADGSTGEYTIDLGVRMEIQKLTVYVVDDNLGPVLINCYVDAGGLKRPIGEQQLIFDAEGYNAVRFDWVGNIPLSKDRKNTLYIQWANYCGDDISEIRVVGDYI